MTNMAPNMMGATNQMDNMGSNTMNSMTPPSMNNMAPNSMTSTNQM
jgi:hypothetical protein